MSSCLLKDRSNRDGTGRPVHDDDVQPGSEIALVLEDNVPHPAKTVGSINILEKCYSGAMLLFMQSKMQGDEILFLLEHHHRRYLFCFTAFVLRSGTGELLANL